MGRKKPEPSYLVLMLLRDRAAGPLACERTGVLWKAILGSFMAILYLSTPSVFGLVGVTCGVLNRCECELPSCLLVTVRRLLMFLPQLPFPWTKALDFVHCLLQAIRFRLLLLVLLNCEDIGVRGEILRHRENMGFVRGSIDRIPFFQSFVLRLL